MQYIASLSYGKDSLAMIHVIRDVLDLPLDRIITADVWATDTIPAELPPMVEFKEKADRIIKERWGIEVEHLYATRSFQMPPEAGGRKTLTKESSTQKSKIRTEDGQTTETEQKVASATTQQEDLGYMDFHAKQEHGATQNLRCPYSIKRQKVTYQDLFYKVVKKNTKNNGRIWRFPIMGGVWCNGLKMRPIRSFIQRLKVRWCNI